MSVRLYDRCTIYNICAYAGSRIRESISRYIALHLDGQLGIAIPSLFSNYHTSMYLCPELRIQYTAVKLSICVMLISNFSQLYTKNPLVPFCSCLNCKREIEGTTVDGDKIFRDARGQYFTQEIGRLIFIILVKYSQGSKRAQGVLSSTQGRVYRGTKGSGITNRCMKGQ